MPKFIEIRTPVPDDWSQIAHFVRIDTIIHVMLQRKVTPTGEDGVYITWVNEGLATKSWIRCMTKQNAEELYKYITEEIMRNAD